jgi:NAD(P)-dependent dehydrogenase (short-subunit alcohol dehydrogenase family)
VSQLTRFSGKTVLVTGGASGIGQAVVVRLVSEGASVVAFDVNEAGLRETVAKAAATATSGGAARCLTGSVANETDVKRAIADVIAQAGRLHALINMAGVLRASASTEVSLEQFRAVIDVNLVGTFLFCREALPHLLVTRGCIVNTASTAALFGHPYMAAYAASKGGVYALTRALAWEYLKQGVRVNAVAPGGIATPMSAGVHEATMGLDTSLYQHLVRPGGGFGRPEQVASVVAMLASDDAGYMTGEIVKVDGGVHN